MSYPAPRGNQIPIVAADIAPMSVIACAGSGKTLTAVHRIVAMSQSLTADRSRIALLSFSNVAVETFKRAHRQLTGTSLPRNIEIATLDSFLTTNILKPHAHRTMRFDGVPYLISGHEPFLSGFNIQTARHPIPVASVYCERVGDQWQFFHLPRGDKAILTRTQVLPVVRRLGAAGGYTHNLGRFWAYEALATQPGILRSLANRYRHIIIDEAQDLGTTHQVLLKLLIDQGVQVSLIGDPNQAIYEFIGATGDFLRNYELQQGAAPFQLTENHRSLLPILAVANRISGRDDTPTRELPETLHGAFYTSYRNNSHGVLIDQFSSAVTEAELRLENSAVLCRANALRSKLKGETDPPGVGIVALFADAAIHRDILRDYSAAYCLVVNAFAKLLHDPPKDFVSRLTSADSLAPYRRARQLLWAFATRPQAGLPPVQRLGNTQWHPQLLAAISPVLSALETDCGFARTGNLGQKLARREIPDGPIALVTGNTAAHIRIDTVHQAKGESLDAVLYIATRDHAEKLVEGSATEIGRIGYVALTRARNLFWLAVPQNCLTAIEPSLRAAGLTRL